MSARDAGQQPSTFAGGSLPTLACSQPSCSLLAGSSRSAAMRVQAALAKRGVPNVVAQVQGLQASFVGQPIAAAAAPGASGTHTSLVVALAVVVPVLLAAALGLGLALWLVTRRRQRRSLLAFPSLRKPVFDGRSSAALSRCAPPLTEPAWRAATSQFVAAGSFNFSVLDHRGSEGVQGSAGAAGYPSRWLGMKLKRSKCRPSLSVPHSG